MVTTLRLAPPYTTENLSGADVPMLYSPHFPGTAGTIKKYLPCSIAWLFHHYPSRWEPWIQMSGALGVFAHTWLTADKKATAGKLRFHFKG